LNYSPNISSYAASDLKQDGGPKATSVLGSRKKENIRFEKNNGIQEKTLKKFDRLAKYIYYIEISLNTSFFKELIPKQQRKNMFIENINCSEKFAMKDK
jgi:hypothetical protein